MIWINVLIVVVGLVTLKVLVQMLMHHVAGIHLFEKSIDTLMNRTPTLTAEQYIVTVAHIYGLKSYGSFAVIDVVALSISLSAVLWNAYRVIQQIL